MKRLRGIDSTVTVVVSAVIILIAFSLLIEWNEKRETKLTLSKCPEPVFLQAVGHRSDTTWVYGCSDGSMIELPDPLPASPVGTPGGWAGGH